MKSLNSLGCDEMGFSSFFLHGVMQVGAWGQRRLCSHLYGLPTFPWFYKCPIATTSTLLFAPTEHLHSEHIQLYPPWVCIGGHTVVSSLGVHEGTYSCILPGCVLGDILPGCVLGDIQLYPPWDTTVYVLNVDAQ